MLFLSSFDLDEAGVVQEKLPQGAEHMTDQRGGEHERAGGKSEAISYPIRKA